MAMARPWPQPPAPAIPAAPRVIVSGEQQGRVRRQVARGLAIADVAEIEHLPAGIVRAIIVGKVSAEPTNPGTVRLDQAITAARRTKVPALTRMADTAGRDAATLAEKLEARIVRYTNQNRES